MFVTKKRLAEVEHNMEKRLDEIHSSLASHIQHERQMRERLEDKLRRIGQDLQRGIGQDLQRV